MRSVRRECETRVNRYEDRIAEIQSDMQREIDKQAHLLKKITKERDEARSELVESQQSVRSLFNEQKRLEKSEDRMKDEINRSNKAMDKMRDEAVRLRSRVNELQHEKNDMKKQHDSHLADEEEAAAERVTVLMDLRSLLDRRNQQLNDLERSRDAIEEDRAHIQLHSTEVQVTTVSLRRELEEARATALAARTSEEAARLQITRMMDGQLVQGQTIEALRRQVESSNTSAQQARSYVPIKNNSHVCLRLTLPVPVELEVPLVALL
jgi:chromosome segregation ATPase